MVVPAKSKNIKRHRHFRGKMLGKMGFCTSWAIDKHDRGREWIEVVDVDMQLDNLPQQFVGKKIVQVSDLHYGNTVSRKYLRRCIERVNQLEPDLVVLTGDYITHDLYGRFRSKVVEMIGKIESKHGTFACLGNHDYGFGGFMDRQHNRMLDRMVGGMEDRGISVLRNDSRLVEVDGGKIHLVGLGDLGAGDFRPDQAFDGVPEDSAVIVLMHNPKGMDHLEEFSAGAVMAGHTHGARYMFMPSKTWMFEDREFHAGMYEVDGKKLYVNRGLGRVGKTIFNTPPEITVFTLH